MEKLKTQEVWVNIQNGLPELRKMPELESLSSDWVQCATDTEVLLDSFYWNGSHWYGSSYPFAEERIRFWRPLPEPPGVNPSMILISPEDLEARERKIAEEAYWEGYISGFNNGSNSKTDSRPTKEQYINSLFK